MLPWLLLVAWIQPTYSSALYAFATDRTTQVGIQDPSTGKIYYSSCTSEDTPIFPLDKPNVLDTDNKPRNGTALAGAGWWDTQKIIVCSHHPLDWEQYLTRDTGIYFLAVRGRRYRERIL